MNFYKWRKLARYRHGILEKNRTAARYLREGLVCREVDGRRKMLKSRLKSSSWAHTPGQKIHPIVADNQPTVSAKRLTVPSNLANLPAVAANLLTAAAHRLTVPAISLPAVAANPPPTVAPIVADNQSITTEDNPVVSVVGINTLTYMNPRKDKMVLNVGGIRHETLVKTLAKMPDTRLGQLALHHHQHLNEEYFFDRNPEVFNAVIDYYRSEELHIPMDVCGVVIRRELEYWNLRETLVQPCCWVHYSSHVDKVEALAILNAVPADEQKENADMLTKTGLAKVRLAAWRLMCRPNSSIYAKAYSIVSMLFVMLAITECCLETIPQLQNPDHARKYVASGCSGDGGGVKVQQLIQRLLPSPIDELRNLDYLCNAFFSFELIIRLLVAPKPLTFIKSPITVIDIVAIIPFYLLIIFDHIYTDACLRQKRSSLFQIVFILRIVRIFRVFQMLAYFKPLKILIRSLIDSVYELMIILVFVLICMLVFATLAFYAEINQEGSSFTTIPVGFWWVIVTITTVGYGDMYPRTIQGYFVGGACALCGVIMMALTIPIVSNNFTLYYTHSRSREQATEKEQKRESQLQQEEEQYGSIKRSFIADGSILINEPRPTTSDISPDSDGVLVFRHRSSATSRNDARDDRVLLVGDKEDLEASQTNSQDLDLVSEDNIISRNLSYTPEDNNDTRNLSFIAEDNVRPTRNVSFTPENNYDGTRNLSFTA